MLDRIKYTAQKNYIIKALYATDEKLKYMQQQVFIIKVIMEAELGDAFRLPHIQGQ